MCICTWLAPAYLATQSNSPPLPQNHRDAEPGQASLAFPRLPFSKGHEATFTLAPGSFWFILLAISTTKKNCAPQVFRAIPSLESCNFYGTRMKILRPLMNFTESPIWTWNEAMSFSQSRSRISAVTSSHVSETKNHNNSTPSEPKPPADIPAFCLLSCIYKYMYTCICIYIYTVYIYIHTLTILNIVLKP